MRSKPKTVFRVNYNLLVKAIRFYILRSEKCLDSVSNSYLVSQNPKNFRASRGRALRFAGKIPTVK